MIDLFNTNLFFNFNAKQSWRLFAKIGLVLIAIGILIYILKELIIGILSAVFIGLGIYCLFMAFNVWNSGRF